MNSWKDKVASKLSHILADSPPSPSPAADSSTVSPQPQELPLPAEELNQPQSGSITSYLFSFIPGGNASVGYKSNELAHQNGSPRSSLRFLPSRWRKKKDYWKDRLPDETERDTYTTLDTYDDDPTEVSERRSGNTEKFESPSALPSLAKYLPNMIHESSFISPDLYEFFHSCLPNLVKGCDWVLLYSTLKHGISLRTLFRRSAELPGYCLLVIRDKEGAIFGGLLEGPLQPTAKRKYQGTNQTFVFTTIYGDPRLFRATGANRFFYLCLNDLLAFGGGGNFALCLDEDLLHGTSGPCETFGNLCLAHCPEFELKNVELWGFTHAKRYTT